MNTIRLFDFLTAAFRYWYRTFRREPMFAMTAILTLALGVGATTAIFSVVNGVLIKPLPYPDADRLVGISHVAPGMGFDEAVGMSPSMLFTYGEESRVFQAIGGWSPGAATVTGLAEPERARVLMITYGLLQAMDVAPLLGRWVSRQDDAPGADGVLLLSYGYWQRRFGGDRGVVGRSITVDSRPRRIIGVMPRFFFRLRGQDPDLFIPLQLERSRLHLGDLGFLGIARLKAGVTLAQANADVARMIPIWLRSWPGPNAAFGREVFEKAHFAPALGAFEGRGGGKYRECSLAGHGGCRTGPFDCLRQRGEPVTGEGRVAPAGARHPSGAGRGPRAGSGGVAHGKPAVRRRRRPAGPGICGQRIELVAPHETGESAATRRDFAGRLRPVVRLRRLALFVSGLRTSAGPEIHRLRSYGRAANGQPRERGTASCAKSAGSWTGLPGAGSTGDVRPHAPHV